MKQLRYIELFSGIGGFRLGLEKVNKEIGYEGFEHVWSNEYDKYSSAIYEACFGKIDRRDIATVKSDEIPEHDLLTAGFPCQAFSLAGNRLGFEDTRGTLFFEVARILRDKRPRYFLLENVKGLLSNKGGETFSTILRVLSDLGYVCEWEVLNSKYFGVPQNRERIFIAGHLRGGSGRKVFPLRREGIENDSQIVSTTIDRNYWKGIDNHGQRTMIQVGNIDQRGHNSLWGRVYDPEGLSATINAHGGGLGAKTGLYRMVGRNPANPSDRTTGAPTEQRLEPNSQGISNTITTVQKDNLWVEGDRVRRLTPRETERLQGFPDDWTKYGVFDGVTKTMSDTRRYMGTGNAVPTVVVTGIGKKLLTI